MSYLIYPTTTSANNPHYWYSVNSQVRNSSYYSLNINNDRSQSHLIMKRNSIKIVDLTDSSTDKNRASASSSISSKLKCNDDPESDMSESVSYQTCYNLWMNSSHHGPVLRSQWKSLLNRTLKYDQGHTVHSFSLSGDHVVGLFKISKGFKANFNVRFRAVELFDRYLQLFSHEMAEHVMTSSYKDREEFRKRFESQILLRMCSCLQIASKLHTDQQALTPAKIKKFLKSEGFNFSIQNVVASEFRILDMLEYKCHWPMPIDLVQQLLCLSNLNLEYFQRAHYFSILLLDFFYSDADNINQQYLAKKGLKPSKSKGRIPLPLQAAAIVLVALFIVAAETKTADLHVEIQAVLKNVELLLPQKDVYDLAATMLDILNIS